MQVISNYPDAKSDQGLQLGLREQQNTALLPARRPLPARDQVGETASDRQNTTSSDKAYASYSVRNGGVYDQAVRAYQESARFEESIGQTQDIFKGSGSNEKALTDLLREEPLNGTAWSELGLLYYSEGKRDKVSAIYQILQEINSAKADRFSTQLGLHEKLLFNVA